MTYMDSEADLIVSAASVVNPIGTDSFTGTLDEALDVMRRYAAIVAEASSTDAQSDLTMRLRNSNPDRVAEMCAAALLELADIHGLTTSVEVDVDQDSAAEAMWR